jgi:hypothetical protein
MALSPLKRPEERAVQVANTPAPTRTYGFNLGTGEFSGYVDEKEAMKQFVAKAVATARFRYLIYDGQYGCELDDLIGQDVTPELLTIEIPRVIKEALIYDERIVDVGAFSISREGDKLFVEFTVHTIFGEVTGEVTI